MNVIDEGQETIEEGSEKEELAADLALICAAQKVEHYEIAGYGMTKALARQSVGGSGASMTNAPEVADSRRTLANATLLT